MSGSKTQFCRICYLTFLVGTMLLAIGTLLVAIAPE